MKVILLTLTSVSALVIAACTTTTAPRSELPSGPEPSDVFASTLHLCKGDHVDNAPATDSERHIINLPLFTRIAGVSLARVPVRRACFSSGFGFRHDRVGRHNGIDLSTGHPHDVYAAGDGVIEELRVAGGYGNMILIRHNDRAQTRYGHLSSYGANIHIGHEVQQGDVIGKTGNTGNAEAVILHYEIIVDGTPRDLMSAGK